MPPGSALEGPSEPAGPPQTGPSALFTDAYRRYTLVVLLAVFASSHVDRQILAILLQSIKQDLLLTDTQLGFLGGIAFALFYATLGIPIAMWADRSNRRNIIAAAVTIWSGMTALCGMAGGFGQLALARIGVGVGEAGSSPPSHSILSDLYPPEKRATAMAIFALGINLGILVGFLVGGWVNEYYGWRMAFYVVGLPGLLIALVVRFTLREPPRGLVEGLDQRAQRPPALREVLRFIASRKALVHLMAGSTLMAFVGYGAVVWVPAFLERSHGLTTGQIGTALALIIGVFGGAGTYLGGFLADRLGRRDVRWNMWVLVIALVAALPFSVAMYLTSSTTLALVLFVGPAAVGAMNSGPTFALTQSLVDVRMRSVASAILLFIINIIGLGLGPQTVGVLSDLLEPRFGNESLRYALLCTSVVSLWAAFHFAMAGRTLRADLARANAAT